MTQTEKYKPFDLKKAIAGHPLVTRDGRKVQEFHYFEKVNHDLDDPIRAVVDGEINSYDKYGKYYLSDEHGLDLFLAPKKIKKWINIYKHKDNYYLDDDTYISEQEAKAHKSPDTITTMEIEFEDDKN